MESGSGWCRVAKKKERQGQKLREEDRAGSVYWSLRAGEGGWNVLATQAGPIGTLKTFYKL